MVRTSVAFKTALLVVNRLIGKPICRVSVGYAASLFLEIGNLHEVLRYPLKGEKKVVSYVGDWTFWIEGNWKLYCQNTLVIDSMVTDYKEMDAILAKVVSARIENIRFTPNKQLCSLLLSRGYMLAAEPSPYRFLTINDLAGQYLGFGVGGQASYEYEGLRERIGQPFSG